MLVDLSNGNQTSFDEVRAMQFTSAADWLILEHHRPNDLDRAARTNATIGSPVTLVSLNSDQRLTIPFVRESAIDSTGRFLVVAISDTATTNKRPACIRPQR